MSDAHRGSRFDQGRIHVALGGRVARVDLGRLYVQTFRGARVVSLADVWVAAQLPGDLLDLVFDFVSEDGYRPSQAHAPPLPPEAFMRGYLDISTRDLVWADPVTAANPAYLVRGLRTIVAEEARVVAEAANG